MSGLYSLTRFWRAFGSLRTSARIELTFHEIIVVSFVSRPLPVSLKFSFSLVPGAVGLHAENFGRRNAKGRVRPDKTDVRL